MTSQEVIHACDRAIAGAQELKSAATQMQQSDQQIREKQSILASLEGKIAQAKQLASQVEQVDQQIRARRSELADLEATIAKKHADHGAVENKLRDLRKALSGNLQHV